MPIKETERTGTPASASKPTESSLLVLTGSSPQTWSIVAPGHWMGVFNPETPDAPVPMVLIKVKTHRAGRLELTFRCCGNPRCTRTIKLEGHWNGRHENLTQEGGKNARDALK